MGGIDRAIRFAIAAVIVTLYFTEKIDGILAIILVAFAFATTFTGVSGYCPLYTIFGWNTCKVKDKE